MFVVKRDGRREAVCSKKIFSVLENIAKTRGYNVDVALLTDKLVNGMFDGMTTQELWQMTAEVCASMSIEDDDYDRLATFFAVTNLHRHTKSSFSEVIHDMYSTVNEDDKQAPPMTSYFYFSAVYPHGKFFDSHIKHERDFEYSYFGFKTLERSYLLKINGVIVERPQHMLMRVSFGIHGNDTEAVLETYNMLSERYFVHASPTLFSAATREPQMSSCFLLTINNDSIEGIFETLAQCAAISKTAGGIGLNVHCIRAKGTYIAGTNGTSNGLVPMLRVFNNAAKMVQGGNKRPGSVAIYLEPWHADIFEFLDLKKNTGKDELRARDLFYGLWIPDLFMKRVESNGKWSLMCPRKCPGLDDVWGDEFEELYCRYEREGRANKTINAQQLWFAIIESQVETGTPYMMYKDACNRKSNQQNLGTIKSSNLCTEIVQYSSPSEVAVCNLASIAVNQFVSGDTPNGFDFNKLKKIVKIVTRNLNKIIDVNHYPVFAARRSNMYHRPIGIGVQGFADALMLMQLPYESKEAQLLNQQIFETLYYGALEASCELAEKRGPYETYEGSPVSKGILQYDMWNKTPTDLWDWQALKDKIKLHGVRNSLLVAPMPTASTAQILGNNESFEPYTSNIYSRRVLSGEFPIINKHLRRHLKSLGLWDSEMKNEIISLRGSVQGIERIPAKVRELYKTVWEIPIKTTMQMAADRGAFIDQSQSFNIYVAEPNYGKLTSMHFHGWKLGLKTGMYYLRTKPAANAIQFTVDKEKIANNKDAAAEAEAEAAIACSLENKDECVMCGA